MNRMPLDFHIRNLIATVEYGDRIEDAMETMTALYLDGEVGMIMPALRKIVPDDLSDADYSLFLKHLVIDRNHVMADRAAPLIDRGSAFVAIGAMHLPGRKEWSNCCAIRATTSPRFPARLSPGGTIRFSHVEQVHGFVIDIVAIASQTREKTKDRSLIRFHRTVLQLHLSAHVASRTEGAIGGTCYGRSLDPRTSDPRNDPRTTSDPRLSDPSGMPPVPPPRGGSTYLLGAVLLAAIIILGYFFYQNGSGTDTAAPPPPATQSEPSTPAPPAQN